jgi:GYF domain 2
VSSRSWLYMSSGQQLGPVLEDELRDRIRAGQLEPTALVWAAGMADWQPADAVLPAFASPEAPPILPIATAPYVPVPWDRDSIRAAWSLALGLLAVFGLFPVIQLPSGIAGLVLGLKSLSSPKRGLAVAGVVLSSLGLVFMLVLVALFVNVAREVGFQPLMQELLREIRQL